MAPEVDNVKKTKKKKIKKLALRTSLRRSSIYDKLPHTTYNNVIISDSDTTETDCSVEENHKEVKDNSDLENRKYEKQKTPDVSKNHNGIIITSDSDDEVQHFETPIKTENIVDEYEKILDELYGNSWRANKEHVLSFSEKRQPKEINIKKDILPYTERKPKPSITHKNEMKTTKTLLWVTNPDPHSSILQERSDNMKNNKNTKEVPKSNKNEVQKEEKNHKTQLFEGLLLPESNLKNILSIDRKTVGPEINKPKKVTKNNTNVKKNGIQNMNTESKQTRPNKNVKYFATSSNDSDSSDESLYIDQNRGRSKIEGTLSFLASLSGCAPVDKCDASARIFRSTYKTSKEELAKKLFNLYNEKVFNNSISKETLIEWNGKMRGTAGFCYCGKTTRATGVIERKVRIVLATKILDSADRLRDTLIHEMCHAATWIVNQTSHGHGSHWKAWAAKAMKTFPELPPIKTCHDYVINTKYTYKCCNCGYSIGRHSKSLDVERKRCGYCYGKFEIFVNKTSKGGIKAMTPATPKREPTGFALFVKENYSDVRKENMNHAEVMKILSKKFSEFKST